MRYRFWSDIELDILRKMFAAGHEAPIIAEALGRSIDSVNSKKSNLGIHSAVTEPKINYELLRSLGITCDA